MNNNIKHLRYIIEKIPRSEAVNAQTAPIPTGHFAHSMPPLAKATGNGADLSNKKYGTINVSVAETQRYAIQQIRSEKTIANGIFL